MLFYTHNPSQFAFSKDENDFNNYISSLSKNGKEPTKKTVFAILGVPFDSTTTYRPGARFGPSAVREASHNFENYNLSWDCSIDSTIFDLGNVQVSHGNFKKTCSNLLETVSDLLAYDITPIVIGGEHTITYALVKALKDYINLNELTIVHLDAHMDIADSYMGEKYSHATVMRRIFELNPGRLIQVGVRSSSYLEKEFVQEMQIEYYTSAQINENLNSLLKVLDSINGPVYLSIDMDVIDPSEAPSVGNPTPCGINSQQLEELIKILALKQVVAMDIVEVAADMIGDLTSINAAKIILDFISLQGKSSLQY